MIASATTQKIALTRVRAVVGDSLMTKRCFATRCSAAPALRPIIGQRFPLERAADAHRAIESRTALGKTLLEA